MGQVSKACIDALTLQIKTIEAHAETQYKIEPAMSVCSHCPA